MRHPRILAGRAALLLAAVAMTAAACGSGDDTDGSTAQGSGAIVTTESVGGTQALADAGGHTLYTADVESQDILCVDACTSFWEPLMASPQQARQASDEIGDRFGVVQRPDGGTQLTYEGLPLYTFAEEGAGELEGDGFTDDFEGTHFEWSAAVTEGSAAPSAPTTDGSGGYDRGGGGYGY